MVSSMQIEKIFKQFYLIQKYFHQQAKTMMLV